MAKPSMGACAPGENQNFIEDGERRSRDGGGLAAAFVAGLPAMVGALAPDARLLAACEAFLTLDDERADIVMRGNGDLMDFYEVKEGVRQSLRAKIAGARALTELGRRAKVGAALQSLPLGDELALARAALEDCLAAMDDGVGGRA